MTLGVAEFGWVRAGMLALEGEDLAEDGHGSGYCGEEVK